MNRKIYYWKLRSVELQLGEKTLIMGILNVTPDSFSDGGSYSDPDRAYARALELEEQGADIIDIGAESTSPGSQRVSAEEEWRRLVPVLKKLRDKLTIPISIDTYKAETAQRALEYGIEIVNDPSGLTFDADLAKTVANANAGLILNHMRGTPETWAKLPPLPDMIGSVARDLEATINRARRAGVERNRIAVDPGLGFGKRKEQNAEILAHLKQLVGLDCPVLVGPSRKSFLAQPTEPETLYATAAAVAVSILNGAHIVRVHDVTEMRAVALVADEVVRAADAKQAALAAKEAAEHPAPRRNARDEDDRPRSVKPPVAAKKVPQIEVVSTPEPVQAEPVETESVMDLDDAAEIDVPVSVTSEIDEGADEGSEERAEPTPVEERKVPVKRVVKGDDFKKPLRPAAAKPFGDRPPRRSFDSGKPGSSRPPSGDRPPRKDFGDRPPRRDFADRPPRRDFGDRPAPSGDRPPRRDFGDRPPRRDFGDRPPPSGDRPPRRDFGSSRPPSGDRPPRRDYAASRPPSGDRPPRKDFGSRPPSGDRPPRRDFGSSRPPSGDRPPRRDFGSSRPPSGDRPPRRDFGASRPPSGDRPPRRDFGDRPPRRDGAGPPRGPGGGASGPPKRPFRKRP